MTPPTLPDQTPDAVSLRLEVMAQMRDRNLDICGPIAVEFIYDPRDPYALTLKMFDAWDRSQTHDWVVSREMFAVAALWGIETQGLDVSVHPITVTRATPGLPPRDVPCLRICLRETTELDGRHVFTGRDAYLDIVRREVVQWFTTITQVVRIGQEHRHIDIDGTIARLLGRTHEEKP